jgi:hypothetical protein
MQGHRLLNSSHSQQGTTLAWRYQQRLWDHPQAAHIRSARGSSMRSPCTVGPHCRTGMRSVLAGVPWQGKDAWNGRGGQAAMAVAGRPIVEGTQREEGTWRHRVSPMAVVSWA